MKAPLSAAETKPAAEDLAPLPAPEPIPLPDTELEALWDEVNEAPLKGHATSKSEPFAPTNCFKQWRRRLVQAVTPMWAEHGTVATTAEDVALATGIPVKSAAYYLRRQGDLLTEILANHLVRLYQHVCDAADASPGARPVVRLETILLGYLTGAAREPHAHYLLHHALVGLSKAGRNHVRRRYRMVLDVMADPLRELAPAGEPDRRLLAMRSGRGDLDGRCAAVVRPGGGDAAAGNRLTIDRDAARRGRRLWRDRSAPGLRRPDADLCPGVAGNPCGGRGRVVTGRADITP